MPASPPRLALRAARAALGLAAALLLLAPWWLLPPQSRAARGLFRQIWRLLLHAFALEVRVHGEPAGPGTLVVANHVSWTDIAVLGAVLNPGFVAKAEVRGWPLIGSAAARLGCVFVARERRGEAAVQAGETAAGLAAGRSLVLFAEGTTGDGSAVLPFRSSLFDVGDAPVQPVAIHCRHRDGSAFTPAARRRFAWIDDDELLPHAAALALAGGARIDVHFLPLVTARDRKARAADARAAIIAALQAATLNRAA